MRRDRSQRPADGGAAGDLAAAVLGNLALHAEPQRWFQENPVDLAYVSMLKHDAYVVIGAGRAAGLSGRASARRGRRDRRCGLAVLGQLRPEDRPPLPPGRLPSSRSPRPSSTSCEKPGIPERCGLRG